MTFSLNNEITNLFKYICVQTHNAMTLIWLYGLHFKGLLTQTYHVTGRTFHSTESINRHCTVMEKQVMQCAVFEIEIVLIIYM